MEYPGAKFTKPLRRTLLVFFITTFFIATPIIVLYTTGYRFDWQNGILRETGSLSVDIEPKTAKVYLNNLALVETMPVRLKDISPNRYTLEVKAPGYYDWHKEIEIKNKQTTYIKEFILLKKSKPKLITEGQIKELAVSPDGRYLLYTLRENNHTKIFLLNIKSDTTSLLEDLPENGMGVSMVWSKKNNLAAIATPAKPPFSSLKLVQADGNTVIQEFGGKTGQPISKFAWSDSAEPTLFYSTKNDILAFSPAENQTRTVAKNNYLDWQIENNSLWTLSEGTTTSTITITKDTLGFKSEFATTVLDNDSSEWKILAAENDMVLLGNNTAGKMIIVRSDKQFTVAARDFFISPYNNWLVLWSPYELWTYSQGDVPYLLNRSSELLRGVVSMDEFNTLALAYGNKVSTLFPYYLTEQNILGESITALSPDTVGRVLYFGTDKGLWSLNY